MGHGAWGMGHGGMGAWGRGPRSAPTQRPGGKSPQAHALISIAPRARAPCPMPHAPCPMPHAPCPVPRAPHPLHREPVARLDQERVRRVRREEVLVIPEAAEVAAIDVTL